MSQKIQTNQRNKSHIHDEYTIQSNLLDISNHRNSINLDTFRFDFMKISHMQMINM